MPIFSHSDNSTARLFILKSLFDEKQKNLIITDNNHDIKILQNFAFSFLKQKITECKSV